jgi:C-terminal processing protease CtpA/Prc
MQASTRRFLVTGALLLASCGDSDLDSAGSGLRRRSGSGPDFTAGTFLPSASLAAKCQTPRVGTDSATGAAHPDTQGTADDEKAFLRSWTNELYLWYREVPDLDWATAASTPIDYFNLLKTSAVTASGKPKDQFHFTYDTAQWRALAVSGVQVGYGVQWVVKGTPPRSILVAYNEPGSPAAEAGIERGASIVTIDGVDVANGTDTATLNAGLSPSAVGETHTFTLLDRGAAEPRTVTLAAASVVGTPVQNVGTVPGTRGEVGYILFNDHLATSEAGLVAAITQLRDAGIEDLVLDIRYNGGGYLEIAAELGFMIAGPERTAGKTFERTTFNDKHPDRNPITGEPLAGIGFPSTAYGFSATPGEALPHLDLPRVFVLTSRDTCSASEAVINGLRGVDVEVIQIGLTTCGKPYGFYPRDNCGTTYFSIQLQGVNDKGFGDYADGFVPAGTGPAGLPGCVAADDLAHALGARDERLLSTALQLRATGQCPAPAGVTAQGRPEAGRALKSPWHQNRIFRW